MAPYADFTYFGLLLYIVLPTIAVGLFGRANARWALLATAIVAVVQFSDDIPVRPGWPVRELWLVLGYGAWQAAIAACSAYGPYAPPRPTARSSAARPRRIRSWSQRARF